ncbi:MAG TPA: M20/M25/M40 family metallo-hydrolase [Candidatus Binataceae bacterium]|nr:M20/M25/M40 family metallo-hydrolase [Candidatus Binataceae bacterium]
MRRIRYASVLASCRRVTRHRHSKTISALITVTALAVVLIALAAGHLAAADDNHAGLVVNAPAPKPINYDALTQEAATLLQQEIRIDTSNPPGNELPLAKLLKQKLLADGIPATIWQPRPGRGVIAARMRGTGHHNRALILLSHMDVVPANPKEWQVPPFSGEIKDGAIWGRGAIDDKGPEVIELMAMLAIKRAGILLDRDIIFLATGDEEVGGGTGAGWVLAHEADVFADAGYVLNQGGEIESRPNGRRYFAVSITEKTPLWLRLTATGAGGQAMIPAPDNAVARLIGALARLEAYQPAIRVIDPVAAYFKALNGLDGGPPEFLDIAHALQNADYAKTFLAVPSQNAMVRDTFTPTVLAAGDKTNVIPPSALAEIDGSLLPGDDQHAVLADLRKVINDDSIKVDVLLNFPAADSPADSPLMSAIAKLAGSENAVVVPTMIPGFTDNHYFREKGLVAYGFIPIELTPAEEQGIHGVNEHLSIKELGNGIRRMTQLLQIFDRR